MKFHRHQLVLFIALALLALLASWAAPRRAATSAQADAREVAYRANNLGVALLEQFKHKEGAEQFRRALALDPKLTLARINLAIALFNVPDAAGAQKEAQAAAALAPAAPQPPYVLGLLAKQQGRLEEATAAFQRVLKIDPRDVGANVNLGQLYAQQRKYAEAAAAFRVALAEEPYNGTALYNLGTALLRAGQREEGQRVMQQFQTLRQSGAATVVGTNYLEQGRYAEAVTSTGAESDLVDKATPEVAFRDETGAALPEAPNAPGAEALFDYDGDGDLDLFVAAGPERRLYRNDGGKFAAVSEGSGPLAGGAGGPAVGAVAGDFNNDARPDLLVLRDAGLQLYRNEGGGRFGDVTAAAKLPPYAHRPGAAAMADVDHDGDLDLFVAGGRAGAPSLLLRNNGDGTFADVTAAAGVAGSGHAVAVIPTDYDNRRDVDLLVVAGGSPPKLFRNLRDGSFRDAAAGAGLDVKGDFASVAAGDVNKDGFTDFFFGGRTGPGMFILSDGRGRFAARPPVPGTEGALAAQFIDYDNDGLLDLVTLTAAGLRVHRNVGDGWADVSGRAAAGVALKAGAAGVALLSGDLDGDGDTDLLARAGTGALSFLRNDGGSRNPSVRVGLAGKVSNRGGVGAKVEVRAGSLRQRAETYAATPAPAPADVVFGLGRRERADAVRVLWPSGVVQAEAELGVAAKPGAPVALTVPVTELDRKPSSCPYLYAWNGERFEFVTDFMGGGELGYWAAPGLRAAPDPDEYVRLRGDQLKAKGGRFELRVTNELEEALFFDRLQLVAVTHPSGVEVYPNEGLGNPTGGRFKLYRTSAARPPLAATDDHGHDVLERLAHMDRRYPDDFALRSLRGYAEEHALTLDLGNSPAPRVLLLTGWTDYAFSSDNVAAAQQGLSLKPPALQVKDAGGRWRTVIENVGIPVGRPQTVVVDLTGKFLSASREVRVVTNMRIYWDQILVAETGGGPAPRVERLEAAVAELRPRGFSAEVTPDGREPFGYDYSRVSEASPWKTLTGRYTRFGDVRELLAGADDMFVVSSPGDELSISFDAAALKPLPRGWARTFLLYAEGYSKEMDINSASPHEVAPLPFRRMKGYPYAAPEAYPSTPAHRAYVERYNTRVVADTISRW